MGSLATHRRVVRSVRHGAAGSALGPGLYQLQSAAMSYISPNR
jgi:hypothetical protein